MLAEIYMLRLEATARAAKEVGQLLAVRPDHIARLRRRPRSQPNSKQNAPTHHARATGRDLSSTPRWSAGADDQLTNAVACRRFGGSIN